MRKYSERGFKNLEFLRFLLIWAVVGVHIAYLNLSGAEQFSWLVKWTSGWQAVEMFFLMSGFFLFYKVRTEETVLHFALRKWLRLAPFIIALTIVGYIAAGFDIMQYPLSVNIFNSLLLLDWNTHHFGPDATILYVAWFANALFFVSVIYFCIFKALGHDKALLAIGTITFICFYMYSRRVFIVVPFIFPMVRGFAYIGFGILLCEVWKSYTADRKPETQTKVHPGVSALEAVLLLTIVISLFGGSTGIPTPEGLTVPPDQIATLTAQTWFPELTRWALDGVWLQICFVALFWLFLCNRGIISRALNNPLSVTLGKYSYAIFLVHTIVIRALRDYVNLPDLKWSYENPVLLISLVCIGILAAAVAAHHLLEQPLTRWANSKL
ncbi:acyltransferase [uncultured Succinivibrio sp.]|uniref:acyltransferase family protein n=1 Tax=uncultured Succinivibrio sp. TaxID=540749 RepID=UPI0025DABB1B|nr:acyltransferase [uncultured Succinivibrio sp.]